MGEDSAKGDLVAEYTGELVSQEEADRRGTIYDAVNKSYLFNLNAAKKPETRVSRIAKFRDRIIAGKGALER